MQIAWPFWLAVILPTLTYPLITRAYYVRLDQRRADVRRILSGRTLKSYLAAFEPEATDRPETPDELFRRYHDGHQLVLPVVFNMVIAGFFIAVFVNRITPTGLPLPTSALLTALPSTAVAGFAGAFIWSHYDLIARYSALDLTPSSLQYLWLRLLVGAVGGWAIASLVTPALGVPIALAVGVFPLSRVRDELQKIVAQRLGTEADDSPSEPPSLHLLQGATRSIIDRLSEERVEASHHLALSNPVRLLMQTTIEWTVLLDMIDQAYLHIYVGDRLADCRRGGFRGVIEVVEIRSYLDSRDAGMQRRGNELLAHLATLIGNEVPETQKLVDTLYADPQVQFIWDLWSDTKVQGPSGPETDATNGRTSVDLMPAIVGAPTDVVVAADRV